MRRFSKLLFVCTVLFVGSFIVFRQLRLRAQSHAWQPFVATVVEHAFKGDGSLSFIQYSLHAVAGNGSRVDVLRQELPDHTWVYSRRILNIPNAERITVESSTKSAITEPMPSSSVEYYAAQPASGCGAGPGAATKEIMGYHAIRVLEQHSMPQDFTLRVEQWLAPALGCYPLSFKSEYGPLNGPPFRNIREALFVVQGDPPDSFFQVGADFKERSPSEANAEFEKFFPGHILYPDGGAAADQRYYKSRAITGR